MFILRIQLCFIRNGSWFFAGIFFSMDSLNVVAFSDKQGILRTHNSNEFPWTSVGLSQIEKCSLHAHKLDVCFKNNSKNRKFIFSRKWYFYILRVIKLLKLRNVLWILLMLWLLIWQCSKCLWGNGGFTCGNADVSWPYAHSGARYV